MIRHYVTTAGPRQLAALKVLHASMQRHAKPFRLHVLAEGDEVERWASGHGGDVAAVPVRWLLRCGPKLATDRLPGPPRPPRELAWTWRWWFALDVMRRCYAAVVVLDADIMFFSPPDPIFEEIETARRARGAQLAVLPHAFAHAARGLPGVTLESHRRYGLYNAGFSWWASTAALTQMAELCREGPMFADRVHDDGVTRWGEQGNLEAVVAMPGDGTGGRAHVIEYSGAAPGPWNIHTQVLRRAHDGQVFFDGRPLVAWHYHSFVLGGQFANPEYAVTAEQAALLGEPYAAALRAAGCVA